MKEFISEKKSKQEKKKEQRDDDVKEVDFFRKQIMFQTVSDRRNFKKKYNL